MTTYVIVPHLGGDTFDVKIVDANGGRQTILGFAHKPAAEAWIAWDRIRGRREDLAKRRIARFDSQATIQAVYGPKPNYP
jgi:hypothetical protein